MSRIQHDRCAGREGGGALGFARGTLNIFIYLCLGTGVLVFLTLVSEIDSTAFPGVAFGFLTYLLVLGRSKKARLSGLAHLIRNMMVSALALALAMLVLSSFFVLAWRISSTDAIGLDRHHIVHIWDLDLMSRTGPARFRAEVQLAGWPTWKATSKFFGLHGQSYRVFGRHYFYLPIVIIVALLAVPTALLWWLRPRRSDNRYCSQCKYDLTGNISGVCPECGESIHATPDTR